MPEANTPGGRGVLYLRIQSWLAAMNSEGPRGINTLPCNRTCTELHDTVSSNVFHTSLMGTNSPVHRYL